MPLLKPETMADILSTPEISRNVGTGGGLSNEPRKLTSSQHSSIGGSIIMKRSLPERIPAFGLLMAIVSVFCFSIASVIVKETTLPAIEILVWRSLCQFVVYFLTTIWYNYEFFGQPGHRRELFFRCLSGCISQSAIYIAYRLISLSDASTIHISSTVFVTVFEYFLLKEPLNRLQIFTGTLTLTGVVIIAKPEFLFGYESEMIHEMRLEGIILSVIASMAAAFAMITLRQLKTTPVAVVVMWYSFTLVIFGSLYLTITKKWIMPNNGNCWMLLALIGITGILDQYCITLAFQYEKAGPISVVRTFSIVLAFMWEVLLLDEPIEWTSVLGACIIFSCVILLALAKWYQESPKTFDRIRRKLCCFCPVPGPSKSAKRASQQASKRSGRKSGTVTATGIDHINTGGTVDQPLDSSSKNNSSKLQKTHRNGSTESIDSIMVQNTVNSNAVLLIESDDDDNDSDN